MTLDVLIYHLQQIQQRHGGSVICTTNGEYGDTDPQLLTDQMIDVGRAILEHDHDACARMSLATNALIVHIGGY